MTEREAEGRPPSSEHGGSPSGEPPAPQTQASAAGEGDATEEASTAEGAGPVEASAPAEGDAPEEGGAPEEVSAPEDGSTPDAGPYRVTVMDLGRFAVAAVTVVASLIGLVLGIRAEQRGDREDQRATKEEQYVREQREKAYTERVDFYRMGSEVIVVNGSSRVMTMRLTLPEGKAWWELDRLLPCKQIVVPNQVLLQSMASEQPSLKLAEGDLAQLRLEFIDPDQKAWIRSSGGVVARMDSWTPSVREGLVSSEAWNVRPESSPQCDAT